MLARSIQWHSIAIRIFSAYEKKVSAVMFINFTNINKTNIHFSSQLTSLNTKTKLPEHQNKPTTYDVGNSSPPGLTHVHDTRQRLKLLFSLQRMLTDFVYPFGSVTPKHFKVILFPHLLTLGVSDKGYSRNMSCALNDICTFVKYSQVQWWYCISMYRENKIILRIWVCSMCINRLSIFWWDSQWGFMEVLIV